MKRPPLLEELHMRVVIRFASAMAFVVLVVTAPVARGSAQTAEDVAR